MSPPPRLGGVLRLGRAEAAVAQTVVRTHGSGLRPFADIISRFGAAALADVLTLTRTLHSPIGKLTDTALDEGWVAARRLFALVRKTPGTAERTRAALDVQRSMLSLLSRQQDLTVHWTDAITEAVLAARARTAAEALKLAPTLAKSSGELAATTVLAQLSADLPDAVPQLRALWALVHKALPQYDAGLLKAAALAADQAPSIRTLLRGRGVRGAMRQSALWGHVSSIRGALGEAHALADKAWLELLDQEYLRALNLAADLGPGWEVRYLTDAANQLLLNGKQGPDAVLTLVNHATREMVDVTRAQVKIAKVAESADQSVNDVWRLIGEERAAASGMPATYTVTLDGSVQTFTAVMRPSVVPRIVLLNPAGSRIPVADLDMLRRLGLPVDEIQLALTVRQYNHLTISLIESAIKKL